MPKAFDDSLGRAEQRVENCGAQLDVPRIHAENTFECLSVGAQRTAFMVQHVRPLFAAVAIAITMFSCSSTSPRDVPRELTGHVGMNDVSVLFPLPAVGELDRLLSPSSLGGHGELLPSDVLQHLPSETKPEHLRVVAARLDPCFPSLAQGPSPECRFQVRLVLQPLLAIEGEVRAEDIAVHAFYELSPGGFVDLLAELLTVVPRGNDPDTGPLRVQPDLLDDGRVQAAWLDAVGSELLVRVTFMTSEPDARRWTFGGFDLAGDSATPMVIGNTGATQQSFENTPSDPSDFAATVAPPPVGSPVDSTVLYDSQSAKGLDDAALWKAYESVLRIENPDSHSSETLDCVTCHTAEPARRWLERNAAFASKQSPLRYESTFDLSVQDPFAETSVLRAFGWHGSRPAISTRTVHETAAVASYLNRWVVRAAR